MNEIHEETTRPEEESDTATSAFSRWADKHPWLLRLLPPMVFTFICTTVIELQAEPVERGIGVLLGIFGILPITFILWLVVLRIRANWPKDWRVWWATNGTVILLAGAYWLGHRSGSPPPGAIVIEPQENANAPPPPGSEWLGLALGILLLIVLLCLVTVTILSKLGISMPWQESDVKKETSD